MLDTKRIVSLFVLLGGLGASHARPALAQEATTRNASRKQFVQLLLRREDQAMEQLLALRKQQLAERLNRLTTVTQNHPRQAKAFQSLEQHLDQRVRIVEQQMALPHPSPLGRNLEVQTQRLQQQAQQIEVRLQRLQHIVPRNPRIARRIERSLSRLEQQYQQTNQQIQFLDRTVATPIAPSTTVDVLGLRIR